MATLSVLQFDGARRAERALPLLREAQLAGKLPVQDAALVSWASDSHRPALRQVEDPMLSQPLSVDFWHWILGATWLLPIALQAVGDPRPDGGLLASLGVEDSFLRQLRGRIVRGTSALLLWTADATPDRVVGALGSLDFTLLSTSLTDRQHGSLLAAFGTVESTAKGHSPLGARAIRPHDS